MKKFFLFILLSIVSMNCLLFAGCNQNTKDPLSDFKIEKINQEVSTMDIEKRTVLFEFTYTQLMFEHEIEKRGEDLVIKYRINDEVQLNKCGYVNAMFGINYGNGKGVLAHKPNEKVYFYIDFYPGDYNLTFYLIYDNIYFLRECSTNFNVL